MRLVLIGEHEHARSIDALQLPMVVLAFYAARPDIDARRTVVFGQSHGGFTTLALGALGLPNVVGLVNFAGGLRQEGCNGCERSLDDAVASYARTTSTPSL